MPTKLPPIQSPPLASQQLIRNVEQARAEQMATLSKILGITVGNSVLATVEKVEPITPQQREELLKRTQETLQQLYKAPATPAIKAQITQLLEQQQLLSSPQLKWAHLQVNGRALLTYTDKPLSIGQNIPLQLSNAQRLVMVDPLLATKLTGSLTPTAASTTSSMNHNATASSAALLNSLPASGAKLTFEAGAAGNRVQMQQVPITADTGNRKQTQLLLAEVLRNLLPHKDQPQQLYTALPQLQQLPGSSRHDLLSSSLQQALKTVADQLRSPVQLGNPKLLQMIVKNSGIFFEQKLATNLSTVAATKSAGATSASSPNADPVVVTNRLTQDLKGALLQLLSRVNQELAVVGRLPETARAPAANFPSSNLLSSNHPGSGHASFSAASLTYPTAPLAGGAMASTLPGMIQLLQQMPQRSSPELSNKVLRSQLLMLLQQQTLGSLAKIQLQQAHTLNHQQNQTDTTQPTQSWLFDIPVKHGQDVHNLGVRLEQEWVDDEKQNSGENGAKIRQWSVTLSFDLPDAGGFYAQLTVVNDTVSAKLWAEQDATLNEAKIKLHNLRNQLELQGVVVKQISCVKGAPPSTAISLNYSLVDINT